MVSSAATTVTKYLASLPADRRAAIQKVRAVINANLPAGYEEGMQYGMIGWHVPLSRYPDTYNGQPLGVAALASQKGYMALYLTCVYGDPALATWFRTAWAASGKKLDMGKSCVRFKTLDALPLEVIAETIARVDVTSFLAAYERARRAAGKQPRTRPEATPKRATPKRATPKRATPKRATSKRATPTPRRAKRR
jgi:hypothetical protein